MERINPLMLKAQKYLQSAAVLLELEDYDSCASRAYFAMFFSAQAMLLHAGYELPSTRGIRTAFNQAFIDTGKLPERAGQSLNRAAELHEVADYSHRFAVPRQEAERLLQEAEAFVHTMARHVEMAQDSPEL